MQIRKNTLLIILIILVCIFITSICLAIYFAKFSNGLSDDSNKWSAFGSYIGGIMSFVNVIVFIGLTLIINNSEKSRSKQEQEAEISREKQELDYQTKLYITNVRYERLNAINISINEVRSNLYSAHICEQLDSLTKTIINNAVTTVLFVKDVGSKYIDENTAIFKAIDNIKLLFPENKIKPEESKNAVDDFLRDSATLTCTLEFYIIGMLERETGKDSTVEYMRKLLK